MKTGDTGELKERILETLKAHGAKNYRRRELFGMLRIKGLDYSVFKDALAELEESGVIERGRGRKLSLPRPSQVMTGIFVGYRNGGGRVNLPDGERVVIRRSRVGDAMSGDTVRVKLDSGIHVGVSATGMITGIVERSAKPLIGLFQKRGSTLFIIPQDEGYPFHILVKSGSENGAKNGELVSCRFLAPTVGFTKPLCEVTEVLGDPDAPGVDVLAIIKKYELPLAFSPETEQEAASIPSVIPPEEIASRHDLRRTVIVTIDPADAKDFDDAISIERVPDGGFRLGVHIADVSFYVRPDSAMDRDAVQRGTSCYLVDRVVPMLPERLSNGLCSLNPHEDRLTKSVFAEISPGGEITSTSCANTVINSTMRLTYEQVQAHLDGNGKNGVSEITPERGELLKALADLTAILVKRRTERGAIDIDIPEAKVLLDSEGRATGIRKRERLYAHRMVEEAMVLANMVVAQTLGKAQSLLLYRVHGAPDMERLAFFGEIAQAFGYGFDSRRAEDPFYIQTFLKTIQTSEQAHILNTMLLRSLKKAAYSPENIGHYGLALDDYAHFTSPIRRYPDLIVHRQLDSHILTKKPDGTPQTLEHFQELGQHATTREVVADNAERDSIKMKAAEFMTRFLGDRFEGTVSGIMPNGFFVELDDHFVEGLVHVNTLDDDYYEIDRAGISLVGQHTGKTFMVGDRVTVMLIKANKQMGEIDFELVAKKKTAERKTAVQVKKKISRGTHRKK
jgi:ribonuclease R